MEESSGESLAETSVSGRFQLLQQSHPGGAYYLFKFKNPEKKILSFYHPDDDHFPLKFHTIVLLILTGLVLIPDKTGYTSIWILPTLVFLDIWNKPFLKVFNFGSVTILHCYNW